jgi:transcriptional regulator with PAS, ATPase and Fis domain
MKNPRSKQKIIESNSENINNPQDDDSHVNQDENLHSNDRYLLNSLMDNLPEHIYFKDRQSRFLRISKSLAKAFGLEDPTEAIGKTDFDSSVWNTPGTPSTMNRLLCAPEKQ